jgi:hypothetical protein
VRETESRTDARLVLKIISWEVAKLPNPLIGRRPALHARLSADIPCPHPYRLNAEPVQA